LEYAHRRAASGGESSESAAPAGGPSVGPPDTVVCQWGISRPADPPDAWIPPLHRFEMRLFGWLAA